MTLDTSFEFQVAYVLSVIVYAGYVVSVWRRAKRARERLEALRGMKRS